MIGKPQWFGRRKYGGWGVWPKTWQGWAYLVVAAGIFMLINAAGFLNTRYQTMAMIVWGVVLAADVVDIMIRMPRDEREKLHEAIAERNALWAMIAALAAGLAYRAAVSAVDGKVYIDPVIAFAIVVGLIVKAASNIYLERKN